jgi:NADH-quinone oxidoreductase subunit G
MPHLIIDEQEIEVPKETKVIAAAERLGIMIPRFCYHEALGSVGACRLCAVKFIEGHRKGIDMSCMVEARDGMVVSTTHPEAVAFRRFIIECLMLNHPHDCPVCDEGGHCLLQDETVSGGHGRRRYLGKKRTYEDQDLGPFVQHEMNRCIHCFRCRRFYRDFAGYRDLGVMQIGNREYFGRFESGPLESPFSGNLIDVCPTGVYTDKPARFKGRRWNFERGPSLCLNCSLGCSTTASARYREMVRVEARYNPCGERSFHLRPGAIRF